MCRSDVFDCNEQGRGRVAPEAPVNANQISYSYMCYNKFVFILSGRSKATTGDAYQKRNPELVSRQYLSPIEMCPPPPSA